MGTAVLRSGLLTVSELADALRVKKSWVYGRTAEGTIPCVKVGRYNRYDLEAVLRALADEERAARLARPQ